MDKCILRTGRLAALLYRLPCVIWGIPCQFSQNSGLLTL
jgi:hypothetical protein